MHDTEQPSGHLLILTPGFPESEKDTTCLTYLQNYLLAYKARFAKTKITVLTLQYPFIRKNYNWNGIEVHSIGGKNRGGLHKLETWFSVIRKFRKIHKNLVVDVIHSFWLNECALLGNYLHWRFGIRHICTAMGTELDSSKYLPWIQVHRLKLVAPSVFFQKKIQDSLHGSAVTVVPWTLQPPSERLVPFSERTIDILGVGSLIPLKNYNEFIEITRGLLPLCPNLNVKIIGDGQMLGELKKLVLTYGLEEYIELLGTVENKAVLKYMRNSKVLLHPSSFESFGYVFLEALSSGMNIVSRKVGFAQAGDNWYLAENRDEFIAKTKLALSQRNGEPDISLTTLSVVQTYHNLYFNSSEQKV